LQEKAVFVTIKMANYRKICGVVFMVNVDNFICSDIKEAISRLFYILSTVFVNNYVLLWISYLLSDCKNVHDVNNSA
jgi:hypothetical protein